MGMFCDSVWAFSGVELQDALFCCIFAVNLGRLLNLQGCLPGVQECLFEL